MPIFACIIYATKIRVICVCYFYLFKRMKKIFFFAALVLFSAGCQKPHDPAVNDTSVPTGTLSLRFRMTGNGNPLLPYTPFRNALGYSTQIEALKCYLGDIKLIRTDGIIVPVQDVALVDFTKLDNPVLETKIPIGNYKGILFGVGVPARYNNAGVVQNPTDHPLDHPLYPDEGMFWTWSSGYQFLKVEGKADTSASQSGVLNYGFFYHLATNALYDTRVINNQNITIQKDTKNTHTINFEFNDFMVGNNYTLDMKTTPFNETESNKVALSKAIIGNFRNALK